MVKGDNGKFLRELTDLILEENLSNATAFFEMKETNTLRLYYEYQSAGMAAFIIRWALDRDMAVDEAATLLSDILLQAPSKKTKRFTGV